MEGDRGVQCANLNSILVTGSCASGPEAGKIPLHGVVVGQDAQRSMATVIQGGNLHVNVTNEAENVSFNLLEC